MVSQILYLRIYDCFFVEFYLINFYTMENYLTLLGLGLIKINDVSANFNNPRPSLILNN